MKNGSNGSIAATAAVNEAAEKARKLTQEAERAQLEQRIAEEKATQLAEAAKEAQLEAEQKQRENKAREERKRNNKAGEMDNSSSSNTTSSSTTSASGTGGASSASGASGASGAGISTSSTNVTDTTSSRKQHVENPEEVDSSDVKKTKSQNELMALLEEAREFKKQKELEEVRANSPSQVAKREAADLAEYEKLSQEVDSELKIKETTTRQHPTDSVVSTASSIGGEGSDSNDIIEDAKRASKGRSERVRSRGHTSSHSSSHSGSHSGSSKGGKTGIRRKTDRTRETLSWKVRVSTEEVIEKYQQFADNLIVSPVLSLFEIATLRVPQKDPVTKKDLRDEKGRVVTEKKMREARRLVFPFNVLTESPAEMVCEIARGGFLDDLKLKNEDGKEHPDFKLRLKETDFDRMSDELVRIQNTQAIHAVEWWCREKGMVDTSREKGRSIWSVSCSFFSFFSSFFSFFSLSSTISF